MLIALSLACTPPVEAPAEIGELTLYMYENFDGGGEDGAEALPAALVQLDDWLGTLPLSLEDSVDDRAVTPPKLPESRLGGAAVPSSFSEELQVPVAVAGEIPQDMDTQLPVMLDANQVCIASGTTVFHEQRFLTDEGCFTDGSCESLETEHEIQIDSLNNVWIDMLRDYRWVELEDGRQAVVARAWTSDQANAYDGDGTWDQRYDLMVWLPTADGSGLRRFYSMWSSVTLSGVSDDFYATTVKNGLDEHFVRTETFANGESCDDRDNAYTRSEDEG